MTEVTTDDRRLVNIQFQRYFPQTASLTVAVPATWDDATVKGCLEQIYDAAQLEDVPLEWHDQVDAAWYDAHEGEHELDVEPATGEPDYEFPERFGADDDDRE
jgi:hypothetical protein